jgi:hypothetical protein
MRTFAGLLLCCALFGITLQAAEPDDDPAAQVAARKKKAEENWQTVQAGEFAHLETKHLLIYAPSSLQKQLKTASGLLENSYELARKALRLEEKDAIGGKVTVYQFGSREPFTAFLRRVEKRRVEPEDVGSFSAADDDLHIAASPPRKPAVPFGAMACEQLAGLLLSRKAGKNTPLPGWLVSGFGRATYYRAAPRDRAVLDDRKLASRLARVRSAASMWDGTADAEEMDVLAGSLVDFLAYGPGTARFAIFITSFQPGEGQTSRTTAEAMEAAGWQPDVISEGWKVWAAR